MSAKRGTCGVCGGVFVLKKDGTLRHHTNQHAPRQATIWAPVCKGVDTEPVR